MATKKKSAATSEVDSSAENEKTEKIAEKLKDMGMMGEDKKPVESKSSNFSPLLLTILVVIFAAGVLAYLDNQGQFDDLQSPFSNSTSSSEVYDGGLASQPQTSPYANAAKWNRPQEPEWVAQRRAEMEKRRAEYEKQRTEQFASNNNEANHFASSEPPQWVKDQQAKMKREQAKYYEQWAKQSAEMANNRVPGYIRQPDMNRPQAGGMIPGNQMPAWQNQRLANTYQPMPGQYNNGYAQPVNPYNTPYYGNGPYNVPYGYPYR